MYNILLIAKECYLLVQFGGILYYYGHVMIYEILDKKMLTFWQEENQIMRKLNNFNIKLENENIRSYTTIIIHLARELFQSRFVLQ